MMRHLSAMFVAAALLGVPSTKPEGGPAAGAAAQRGVACFAEPFRQRLERGIAGYADVVDIPGISYGIVRGDALVVSGGIGDADRSAKRAATADTPYNVGSITKVFTATLALMLVEDGVLELDAPVATYLPDSVRVPRDARGSAVTVRSLLNHTSGLARNPPNRRNQAVAGPIDPGIWEAYSVADLYAGLRDATLKGEVGQQFGYSNIGYALLGHLVERVTGRPYEQVLRDRLLGPLDMRSSAMTLSPAQERELAAFYWTEDTKRTEQRTHAHFGEVAGFIGLTSTVRDLARFVEAHLDALERARNPVPPRVIALMRQSSHHIDVDATTSNDIGFGWFIATPRNTADARPILTHSGDVDGHASGLFLDPAEKIGVVVLQNLGGSEGAAAIDHLGFWLMDRAVVEQRACGRGGV